MIVVGGVDKFIHFFDYRVSGEIDKIKAHEDMIKCISITNDSYSIATGSSDSTIKVWDLRAKKTVDQYVIHEDSVWSLWNDDQMVNIYSGGRDGCVYHINRQEGLITPYVSLEDPILNLTKEEDTLWISTKQGISKYQDKEELLTIPLESGIEHAEILPNRKHIKTRNSQGQVEIWNITNGTVTELVSEDDPTEIKEFYPNWFNLDVANGSLKITLKYPQCLNMTYHLKNNILTNLGHSLIYTLFQRWGSFHDIKFPERPLLKFQKFPLPYDIINLHVPKNTQITITQIDKNDISQIVLDIDIDDFTGEEEIFWVRNILNNKFKIEDEQVRFDLINIDDRITWAKPKIRISGAPYLHLSFVNDWLISKLSLAAPNKKKNIMLLYCRDELLSQKSNIGYIKTFTWKSNEPIEIHYKVRDDIIPQRKE
eukprot:TRINITY_DN6134_c0_g1_i1.p1 TRINITY_DN6134_c0_g1~~TRINITY_DN6134_c0_g1_i1.p1  ORF type:complete len:426 (-),score=70.51 TRINITY_DN6134_c0_g1_i1:280-1557(-)